MNISDKITNAIASAKAEGIHSASVDFGADIRHHKITDPIYADALAAGRAAGFADCYIDGRALCLILPLTESGRLAAAEHHAGLAAEENDAWLAELRGMVRRKCDAEPRGRELIRRIEATIREWQDEDRSK